MSDLLESLRAAKNRPQVALQRFMTLRSNSTNLICVFEGPDDYPYYDTIFRRLLDEVVYIPLIANGKDQVLELRGLVEKNKNGIEGRVAYFIDRDFDGYKGFQRAENTYCTNGYAIENNLCGESVLRLLLGMEYMCNRTDESDTIESNLELFRARSAEFYNIMYQANRSIFFARKNSMRLDSIENKISRYVKIKLHSVTPADSDHYTLIGWPAITDRRDSESCAAEFDSLAPLRDWRGKFILGFYIEFLHQLKEDRCAAEPKYFKAKQGIKFNPKGDIVRTLALLAPIPDCLKTFTRNVVSVRQINRGLNG